MTRTMANVENILHPGKIYRVDAEKFGAVKAGEIIAWLDKEYGLGRGHAMAIVALLKGTKKEGDD